MEDLSGCDSPGLSELEGTLDKNINDILSLLESPSAADGKTPNQLQTKDILKDVVAYVEVRTGAENRSRAVMKELALLGATLVTKVTPEVTHVVFKDGRKNTKNRALKKGLHLVSVLWVDSCKQNQRHMPEGLFRVNMEEMPTPVIGPRWKKCKSMQPKDFEEELANSTERGQKRRRRRDKWKQFDSPANSTPREKHWLYVAETQPRSPSEFGTFSPSLTIPDTPPSMREKLRELRRKRGLSSPGMVSSDHSPTASPAAAVNLQRRLFDPSSNMAEDADTSPVVSPVPTVKPDRDSLSEPLSPSQGDTPVVLQSVTAGTENENTTVTATSTTSHPPKIVLLPSASPEKGSSTSPKQKHVKKLTGKRKLMTLKETFDSSQLLEPSVASNAAQTKPTIFGVKKVAKKLIKDKGISSDSSCSSKQGKINSEDAEKKKTEDSTEHTTPASESGEQKPAKQRRKSVRICEVQNGEALIQRAKSAPVIGEQATKPQVLRRRSSRLPSGITPLDAVTEEREKPKRRKSVAVCSTRDEAAVTPANTEAGKVQKATRRKSVRVVAPSIDNETAMEGQVTHDTAQRQDKVESSSGSRTGTTSTKHQSIVCQEETTQDKPARMTRRSSVLFRPAGTKTVVQDKITAKLDTVNNVNKCPADYDSATEESTTEELATKNKKPCSGIRKRKKAGTSSSETESTTVNFSVSNKPPSNSSMYDSTAYNNTLLNLTKSRLSIDEFSSTQSSSVVAKPKKKRVRNVAPAASSIKALETEEDVGDISNLTALPPVHPKDKPRKPSHSSNRLGRESEVHNKSKSDSTKRRSKKVNITSDSGGESPTATLVMTSLHTAEQEMVHSIVQKLGGFRIVKNVIDTTTHVVTASSEKRRTLNILNAIARGCWVVSLEWVFKSLEASRWLDEEPFEQRRLFPAAQWSRQHRTDAAPGSVHKMPLFADQGLIYVAANTKPPQLELVQLIMLCEGKVTSSVSKADVCIGSKTRASVISVSEQWVLDSITFHRCLPLTKYRLGPLPKDDRRSSSEY